jgi:hypothetical protein
MALSCSLIFRAGRSYLDAFVLLFFGCSPPAESPGNFLPAAACLSPDNFLLFGIQKQKS